MKGEEGEFIYLFYTDRVFYISTVSQYFQSMDTWQVMLQYPIVFDIIKSVQIMLHKDNSTL